MAMTRKQKTMVSMLMASYMSMQTQKYIYNWSEDYNGEEAYKKFVIGMQCLKIDFNNLSESDAHILGLGIPSLVIGGGVETKELYLIPIHLAKVIPVGTEIWGVFSGKKTTMTEDISLDTRGGYLAYCLRCKSNKKE